MRFIRTCYGCLSAVRAMCWRVAIDHFISAKTTSSSVLPGILTNSTWEPGKRPLSFARVLEQTSLWTTLRARWRRWQQCRTCVNLKFWNSLSSSDIIIHSVLAWAKPDPTPCSITRHICDIREDPIGKMPLRLQMANQSEGIPLFSKMKLWLVILQAIWGLKVAGKSIWMLTEVRSPVIKVMTQKEKQKHKSSGGA